MLINLIFVSANKFLSCLLTVDGLLGAFALTVKLQTSLSSSISHRTAVAGLGIDCCCGRCAVSPWLPGPGAHTPPATGPQFVGQCVHINTFNTAPRTVCVPPTLSTHTQLTLCLPTPTSIQRTQGRVNVIMSHIILSLLNRT